MHDDVVLPLAYHSPLRRNILETTVIVLVMNGYRGCVPIVLSQSSLRVTLRGSRVTPRGNMSINKQLLKEDSEISNAIS